MGLSTMTTRPEINNNQLTMTRGLLEDFQRFAKQKERERVLGILRTSRQDWGSGTMAATIIDNLIKQVEGE